MYNIISCHSININIATDLRMKHVTLFPSLLGVGFGVSTSQLSGYYYAVLYVSQ